MKKFSSFVAILLMGAGIAGVGMFGAQTASAYSFSSLQPSLKRPHTQRFVRPIKTPLSSETVSGEPVIESMSPHSGQIGQRVVLRGKNLKNVSWVHFGSGVINPSNVIVTNDGVVIFRVPRRLSVECQFSQVHCMIVAARLQPGVYMVSVETENGRSNSMKFIVTRPTINPRPRPFPHWPFLQAWRRW